MNKLCCRYKLNFQSTNLENIFFEFPDESLGVAVTEINSESGERVNPVAGITDLLNKIKNNYLYQKKNLRLDFHVSELQQYVNPTQGQSENCFRLSLVVLQSSRVT